MGATNSKDQSINEPKSPLSSTPDNEVSSTTGTTTETTTTTTESKCPFRRGKPINKDGPPPYHPPFSKSTPSQQPSETPSSECPIQQTSSSNDDVCPIKGEIEYNVYSQPVDPQNQMPASSLRNQLPSPHQTEELPTERVSSTIPKSSQKEWVYPSPQMFYNALVRKQKLGDTPESDIPSLVALHNNMNETTWRKILQWEETLASATSSSSDASKTTPKLTRFQGKPKDLSPKAWFKHTLLNHPLPFDRHDWIIKRRDGTEVRYVIDYYHDETRGSERDGSGFPELHDTNAIKSILVDVRPALESWESGVGRMVRMPFQRFRGHSTFEPLPMMPTKELREQVKESLRVWDTIMGKTTTNLPLSSSSSQEHISKEEAIQLAKSFATMLKECQQSQQTLNQCQSEEECTKASLGLNMCMAKFMCPLQHNTMQKCLNEKEGSDEYDGKVEAALENVLVCVEGMNEKMKVAKEEFPDVWTDTK